MGSSPTLGTTYYHLRNTDTSMRVADFDYELPGELIARYPLAQRSASRLLYLNSTSGALRDQHFTDLPQLIATGDLLVFNNTKVMPARIFGQKRTGGKIELLIERILPDRRILAHVRASKSPRINSELMLADQQLAIVRGRVEALYELELPHCDDIGAWLDLHGEIPLPPYLERKAEDADRERYQTVYAEHLGAVAAPTAGLHFDQPLLTALTAMGVNQAFLTLHVGAGTFSPVRVEHIDDHHLHAERIEVDAALCAAIADTKARGKRVIAVGTTGVRALEAVFAKFGQLQPYHGETDIFIKPGYTFNVIDAMITNFHLPESTLLMLVSAFAGYEHTMAAYAHAVRHAYRFYSYGDAMLIGEFD